MYTKLRGPPEDKLCLAFSTLKLRCEVNHVPRALIETISFLVFKSADFDPDGRKQYFARSQIQLRSRSSLIVVQRSMLKVQCHLIQNRHQL